MSLWKIRLALFSATSSINYIGVLLGDTSELSIYNSIFIYIAYVKELEKLACSLATKFKKRTP
jgi:hypothetical protein